MLNRKRAVAMDTGLGRPITTPGPVNEMASDMPAESPGQAYRWWTALPTALLYRVRENQEAAAFLVALLTARLGWPLTPDLITWILLPAFRKARVCSAMDSDVSTAAGCFFLAGALDGLRAMRIALSGGKAAHYTQNCRDLLANFEGGHWGGRCTGPIIGYALVEVDRLDGNRLESIIPFLR